MEMKNMDLNHKDNIITETTQRMPQCLKVPVGLMNTMGKISRMRVDSLDNTLFSNK